LQRHRLVRVGIEGLRFEAIHYTSTPSEKPRLHGHSFRVDVVVEGWPDKHGLLIDFRSLRSILEDRLREWDEAVILPVDASTRFEGPFSVKVKRVRGEATTENIACTILDETLNAILEAATGLVTGVRVRVWESYDRYAECIELLKAYPQDNTSADS